LPGCGLDNPQVYKSDLRYNTPMFNQGSVVKLEISEIAAGGAGLAKKDGFPVFVTGAAVGDVIKARITFAKKDFAEAKIEEIIQPSPDRVQPRCKHYPQCGGCALQHVRYDTQIKYKQKIICDTLGKTAGIQHELIRSILPSPSPWYYRNKVQLPLKKLGHDILMGYYQAGTHRVVNMEECFVQETELTRVALGIKNIIREHAVAIYDEEEKVGILRHLIVRGSSITGEILVGFVINAKNLPFENEIIADIRKRFPAVVGVLASANQSATNVILGEKNKLLWGRGHYFEQLGSSLRGGEGGGQYKFKVSFPSFYQVNSAQVGNLYDLVLEMAALRKSDVVLDAYAGVGTIAAYLAPHCETVYGIEEMPAACKDAEENMQLNNIENVRYGQGLVEDILPEFLKMDVHPNIVVLDPPRAGCTEMAIQWILKFKPKKIIYVSCAPATLARDLKKIIAAGYKLKAVQPIDMFPHTPHIESVSCLTR